MATTTCAMTTRRKTAEKSHEAQSRRPGAGGWGEAGADHCLPTPCGLRPRCKLGRLSQGVCLMHSAQREGSELGQLREGVCLMYVARRGRGGAQVCGARGARQGALTSRRPAGVPPTGADRPLAGPLGQNHRQRTLCPSPRPSLPRFVAPPHHPHRTLRSACGRAEQDA